MGVLEPEVRRSTPIHEGMRGNNAQDRRRPSWVPNADRLFGVPDGVATGRRGQPSKVSRTTAGGPRSPQFGTLPPIPPRHVRSAFGGKADLPVVSRAAESDPMQSSGGTNTRDR